MTYKILILGASYGSLLGTKLLMAGHDVTLVCRQATASLINSKGTEVRIKLRDEKEHRGFLSPGMPGRVDATTPDDADPTKYDLVCLAMQEPQYANPALSKLLARIAKAKVPCMSIMNMPPLPYLKRIPGLDCKALESAYTKVHVWDGFEPGLMSLCSPDPQAFRPPEEAPSVLHVGLPTNFKAATFDDPRHNAILARLEADIDAVRADGKDVPVKLRVHDSLFAPFAKWSMLATGNYRCVTRGGMRAIRDAVHADQDVSRQIYSHVDEIITRLGGDAADLVPFEKYAEAANSLLKPSSAARAIAAGATEIERVDKLIQLVGRTLGMNNPAIDEVVATVDQALVNNRVLAA